MVPSAAVSLPSSQRLPELDVVRGFALLGILIMNMPGFGTSFFAEADGSHLWPGRIDQIAEATRDLLFSGKFNSMFSLLFGIGFTIQLGRLLEKEPDRAVFIYCRRLLVLLALGVVHMAVFWGGDVLHVYALLGFLLLLLRRVSDRVIIGIIVACLLYPALSRTAQLLFVAPETMAQQLAIARTWEAADNLTFGHGTFLEAARLHAREFAYFYTDPMSLWGMFGFYVQMTTTMMLGFLIGRHGWVRRIGEFMPTIRRLQWWALGMGLVCSAVFGTGIQFIKPMEISAWKIVISTCYVLSRLGLTSFYVLTVVRLAQAPAWQRRFAPIAATGRAPLTNYLMQTLFATTLFYGWGVGLWGNVGPALQFALAVAIYFAIQVPLSV